jgi:hypothetical protein
LRIELVKNIAVKTVEVLAEVDFFKQSPYIQLLDGITTENKLKEKLKSHKLSQPAIKNILKNLKVLRVLKNGTISNIEQGFPEREFGKYRITYYENRNSYPFKYHVKKIERIKAQSQNVAEDIVELDRRLLSVLNKGSNIDFTTDQQFRIITVLNGRGLPNRRKKTTHEQLSIIFENDQWKYKLANREFNLSTAPDLNKLFEGRWNAVDAVCEDSFERVKNDDNIVNHFQMNRTEQVELRDWGNYEVIYSNVPVVPDKNSQTQWFIHLLRNQIVADQQFLTVEDLEQKWDNLFHLTPQINRQGKIPFDKNLILREFDHSNEMYWLLKTAEDLNPFPSQQLDFAPDTKIVIPEAEQQNIRDVFVPLNLHQSNELTIVDRYINTKRHFEVLFFLKENYENLSISVKCQPEYRVSSDDSRFIRTRCEDLSINREIHPVSDVPHDRVWKIDSNYFNVSKSLDFIELNRDGTCNLKQTLFVPIKANELETQATQLLGGTHE